MENSKGENNHTDKVEMKERTTSVVISDPKNPLPNIPGDPIESAVGAVGRWQFVLCLFIVLVKFGVAWHQVVIIFLAPPTPARCIDPQYTECSDECIGRVFDNETFQNTIVMEWDLTCSRSWMKDMTQTICMLGILVGNMIFAFFADRYGRRWPLIAAVLLQAASGVATSFCHDWYSFTVMRFIVACATGGTMVTSFVLLMEIIGVKYREIAGILFQIPFNVGMLILPAIGYLTRDSWSQLQFWISVPSTFLVIYYWVLPESPRWLLAMGRLKEATEILEKGAKINKLPTEHIAKNLKDSSDMLGCHDDEPKENMLSLFKKPNLRIRTINMSFNWFACGLYFFGVSQYIGQFAGNIFVNMAISSAVQIPGTLLAIPMNRFLGRRKTLFYNFIISGFAMIAIAIAGDDASLTKISLASLGILSAGTAFPTVYIFAGEIFPTVLRNTGIGLCSMVARAGSMIAPFVTTLNIFYYWLPPVIFAAVPLLAAALTLFLPETHGNALPDTVMEAEYYGRRRKSSVVSAFEAPRM